MNKLTKIISLELMLSFLIILSFSLPWVDMGAFEVTGWEIPSLNKQITNITNLLSKSESPSYIGYAIYTLPLLCGFCILLSLLSKKGIAEIFLRAAALLGIIFSLYFYFSLPAVGSGIYMLFVTSSLSLIYCIVITFIKKKAEDEISTTL